jgi:hypothetical protein
MTKMQGLQLQILLVFFVGIISANIDFITPELPLRVKYFLLKRCSFPLIKQSKENYL